MIGRILHLLKKQKRLYSNKMNNSKTECTTTQKISSRTFYNILDYIYKDMDLHPYVQQHKSKEDQIGAFCAINTRFLGPTQFNTRVSEVEAVLHISSFDGKKKVRTWEKYIFHHIKYHVILEILKE